MKLLHRIGVLCLALTLAVAIFGFRAAAQNGIWQVNRADYGFKSMRVDVTAILKERIYSGGLNGFVSVNNQTMGGDPAPGADKELRVFASNNHGQEQEFDYREGAFVPASMFSVRHSDRDQADHDEQTDRGNRRDNQFADQAADRSDHDSDQRDHDGRDDVGIVMAFWGAHGRMVNVTDLLQHAIHHGALAVVANNAAMGIDPAPGADKILIVIYQYHGERQAAAASEGHMLSLP